MDPNLEKLKEVHRVSIAAGDLTRVLAQAKDYLMYIHGHDFPSMNIEFREFKKSLQKS